ncbi:MAG: DoxX family membrane protein [Elusimicrobia bacterium]|nr:DoxX family membrane protein [Elusimicrobiota bacterium]
MTAPSASDPRRDAAAAAARTIVGLILLASGVHKSFAAPEEFAAVIEKYYLLPTSYLLPTAKIMPALEVLIGTALVLGWRVRLSATAAMTFFGIFLTALASTKARGIPLEDCGCFGKGIHLKPEWTMALDTVLLGLSYFSRSRSGAHAWLDAWIERGKS